MQVGSGKASIPHILQEANGGSDADERGFTQIMWKSEKSAAKGFPSPEEAEQKLDADER